MFVEAFKCRATPQHPPLSPLDLPIYTNGEEQPFQEWSADADLDEPHQGFGDELYFIFADCEQGMGVYPTLCILVNAQTSTGKSNLHPQNRKPPQKRPKRGEGPLKMLLPLLLVTACFVY